MSEHTGTAAETTENGGATRRPLVAVLEARRPEELSALLRHRGLEPYHAPAMREEPVSDTDAVARLIDGLSSGRIGVLIVLTGVGTAALLQAAETLSRMEELKHVLEHVLVVARGPKPVAALRTAGLRPGLVAGAPYTTEEVLSVLADQDLAGRVVAVQLAGEPNVELRQGLEARGAQVEELMLYRWAPPADEGPVVRLLDDLAAGHLDAVVFTSSPEVHNLFAIAARHGGVERLQRALHETVVASVGPVCSRTLRDYGVSVDVEPVPPKMGPLVAALANRLAKNG